MNANPSNNKDSRPKTNKLDDKIVQIAHGGGGYMQTELIKFITQEIPLKNVNSGIGVESFDDGATIPLEIDKYKEGIEVVVTADGHTVDPIFFPGGNLGKLAASGTINDLIMMGAQPIALTSVVLIEEGTPFSDLGKVIESFNETTNMCKVAIVAGDSKVLPKGSMKGIIMSTSGVGFKESKRIIADSNCKIGSKIICTGTIGDHGAALMAMREGINLDTDLKSDVQPLIELVDIVGRFSTIQAMKDPTRGGLASALNEWASKSNVGIEIDEEKVKIKKEVQAVSDILGLDPMEVSNEGKAIICVGSGEAEACLRAIRKTSIGKDAEIIGEIVEKHAGMVIMKTPLGGTRIIEMPMGEPIPRVC